jgi:hypothetical protein
VRELADASRIRRLMEAFGRAAGGDVRVYLVGGTTAVLMGWRASTIDVEMVSPADFIPVPPGWEDRGIFIAQIGRVAFYHFDR